MEGVLHQLRKLTGKKHVALYAKGSKAIGAVFTLAQTLGKDRALLQDQGGWAVAKSAASKRGLMAIELKTDYGVIDVKDLEHKATESTVLFASAMPGYFVEQSMRRLAKICGRRKTLFVNDVTGTIGTAWAGIPGDILFCSTGKHKPINLGYGAFLATNNKVWFDQLEPSNFDEKKLEALGRELAGLSKRIKFLNNVHKKILKDLKGHDILHRKVFGYNVVVRVKNEVERAEIINYCHENDYPYMLCPRFIRVLENAVSIEVKRLKP